MSDSDDHGRPGQANTKVLPHPPNGGGEEAVPLDVPGGVVVTGIGVLGSLGDSPAGLFEAFLDGAVGLAAPEVFDPAEAPPEHRGAPRVGEVRGFDPAHYLGKKNFRPLDRTSLLATVAAHLALSDAGLEAEEGEERPEGLVLGTTFGSIHTISAFDRRGLVAGPNYVKPLDFANSVINAPAGQTAIWHRLAGVNSTLTGGPTAGLQALAYAADLIRAGQAESVLAGGAEEMSFEAFFGFSRAGLAAGSGSRSNGGDGPGEGRPVPFDADRDGFALAEGTALLVLESGARARARGAAVRGRVAGHGSAYDPSRGRDAASASDALARAVTLALAEAGAEPGDLRAWAPGACGSRLRDEVEARGVAMALGGALRELPVVAVKAQLGEALGASGGFQAAVLLAVLESGRVPGIPTLGRLDPALPELAVSAETRSLPSGDGRRGGRLLGLATAVGLDGGATAVVLETGPEQIFT